MEEFEVWSETGPGLLYQYRIAVRLPCEHANQQTGGTAAFVLLELKGSIVALFLFPGSRQEHTFYHLINCVSPKR
jgi:hypothetical protein